MQRLEGDAQPADDPAAAQEQIVAVGEKTGGMVFLGPPPFTSAGAHA